jgi:hypothetical protein
MAILINLELLPGSTENLNLFGSSGGAYLIACDLNFA